MSTETALSVRVFQDDDSLAARAALRVRSSQSSPGLLPRNRRVRHRANPPDPFNTDERKTTYGRCSDWRDAEFDISDFRGHFFTTQFIVVPSDMDHGIAPPIRQVSGSSRRVSARHGRAVPSGVALWLPTKRRRLRRPMPCSSVGRKRQSGAPERER